MENKCPDVHCTCKCIYNVFFVIIITGVILSTEVNTLDGERS